ncbi:MAG: phosphatidylglycerol lysyltransferase domain-containing protein [Desulfobacterales bacterium]|jgi:hypothetical protein
MMSLTFKPILLEDQGRYRQLLARCPQVTSDYSFVNLWGWALEYGLELAWDVELVWIRQHLPAPVYWAPVGPWDNIDWRSRMAAIVLEPWPPTFRRVPEALADAWRAVWEDRIQVVEARSDWDYLYALQELVELRGNRFHKKKNLLNQFLKTNDYVYAPFSPEIVREALEMQEEWCFWRDCESSETLAAENRAIERVLKAWQSLEGILGGALRVEKNMLAYTIAEPLTDEMLVIHFEKGCSQAKGVYQAINQMFLAHEGGAYTTVNREQDLGDAGLRKAKLSYNPTGYLKKFGVVFA